MTTEPICVFCERLQKPHHDIFYTSPGNTFIAKWDYQPDAPGHALVIPIRHVQYFYELNQNELAELASAVEAVKEIIKRTDLLNMYRTVFKTYANDVSRQRVEAVIEKLRELSGTSPEGFNDVINDGPAAGQSIKHLHWHIMPRWYNDEPELDE